MPQDVNELRELWYKHNYPYPNSTSSTVVRMAWQRHASKALSVEIRKGAIPKAKDTGLLCVDCGAKAQVWEHRDYTKPFQIEPCCMKCNSRRGPGFAPDHFPEPTDAQLRYHSGCLRMAEIELQKAIKRGKKPPARKK